MTLEHLYSTLTGQLPESVTPLTAAGSPRRYYRLAGSETLIGVVGTRLKENEAFLYLADHFERYGLPAPRVLAVSPDKMCYLQTDLGDTSLWQCRDDSTLLERTISTLPALQTTGIEYIDWEQCYPVAEFDSASVMWDLNYFKYSYLNLTGIEYSEPLLEKAFQALALQTQELTRSESAGLMLRDFQSRNVMVKDGNPYFIDFQGARRGPLAYDVASFIWQAKACFTPDRRQSLTEVYKKSLGRIRPVADDFDNQVLLMALLRTLQVLGAYGYRGLVEKKGHFISSIPYALSNLRQLLTTEVFDRPGLEYLRDVLERVAEKAPIDLLDQPSDGLTVRVTSFSYKKGLPLDPSGNGGGFVFDCRAMDNPGRYDCYKPLTGLDKPVIDFLEERGEIQEFLAECHALIDTAVNNYISRGFTSLAVSFGCTGGKHRSVYSAQHTAEHLKERFPQINVILHHRERGIQKML
ncbi:MAG: phosphotransferase [Duncaniella sp.]|nr:phosphotransferase [Duncaniella sp.]